MMEVCVDSVINNFITSLVVCKAFIYVENRLLYCCQCVHHVSV